MKPNFFNFFKKSTLLTLVVFILGAVVFYFFAPGLYHPFFPVLLLFFYLLSLSLQYLLYKIARMNVLNFSSRFMLITMLKMIILLTLALAYILTNKEQAVVFVIVFFLLYAIYTIMEVQDIMHVTSNSTKQ